MGYRIPFRKDSIYTQAAVVKKRYGSIRRLRIPLALVDSSHRKVGFGACIPKWRQAGKSGLMLQVIPDNSSHADGIHVICIHHPNRGYDTIGRIWSV